MFSKKTLCAICKKAKFSKLFSTACQINLVAMTKVQKSWGTIHFKWIRLFFWLLLFHVPTKVFKKKQFLVDRLQHFRLGLQRWLNFSCFHRNLLVNIFVSRLFHIFSFITWQLSASFYWKTFSLTELTVNKTLFLLIVINGSSFWLVNFYLQSGPVMPDQFLSGEAHPHQKQPSESNLHPCPPLPEVSAISNRCKNFREPK